MQRDYYEVLGVERRCGDGELKAAYKKLAMEHHPDRNNGCEEAAGRFKEISEAYTVLSNPDKRSVYDRFGHAGVNGGGQQGFADVQDIFNEVFGDIFGGRGGRRPAGPQRGQDLRYDLEISLEQAYAGTETPIVIPSSMGCEACSGTGAKPGTSPTTCTTCSGAGRVRSSQGFFSIERTCPRCGGSGRMVLDPCRECHGQGQVRREKTLTLRIPAGIHDGAQMRLDGEGDTGARGGPRGDLYVFISVRPHELFERDGLDLLCTVPVPMFTAILGGEIDAPCLLGGENCDGNCKIMVKVPEGAQTGSVVRLKGRGMPSLRNRARGDLVVELIVETPTRLTARQKELVRELGGLCGEQHHPQTRGFFMKARRFWDGITKTETKIA